MEGDVPVSSSAGGSRNRGDVPQNSHKGGDLPRVLPTSPSPPQGLRLTVHLNDHLDVPRHLGTPDLTRIEKKRYFKLLFLLYYPVFPILFIPEQNSTSSEGRTETSILILINGKDSCVCPLGFYKFHRERLIV